MSLDDYLGNPKDWDKQQAQAQTQQAQPMPADVQQQAPDISGLEQQLGTMQQPQPVQKPLTKKEKQQLTAENITNPIGSRLASTGNTILDFINNMGGGTAKGLSKFVAGAGNLPLEAADYLSGGNVPFRFGSLQNQNIPFFDPNTVAAKMGEVTGTVAPSLMLGGGITNALRAGEGAGIGTRALMNSPRVQNYLAGMAGGAGAGALAAPDNRLVGAGVGAAIPGAIGAAGAGLKVGKNILSAIKNPTKPLSNEMNELVNLMHTEGQPASQGLIKTILTGGKINPSTIGTDLGRQMDELASGNVVGATKDFRDLNSLNASKIKEMFNKQITPTKNAKYAAFDSELEKSGFPEQVRIKYTPEDLAKIKSSEDYYRINPEYIGNHVKLSNYKDWDTINKVITTDDSLAKSAYGKDAVDMLKKFKMSPSPQLAQRTISQLGKTTADLGKKVKSGLANDSQINAYHELTGLRNSLKSSLDETLTKSGAHNAKAALLDANKYYKNDYLPYLKAKGIKTLFNEDANVPGNIPDVLSKDSQHLSKIREHILNNPSLQNSLLAQQLSKGATYIKPAGRGMFKFGKQSPAQLRFEDVEKNYNTMPNVLKDLVRPEYKNALESIINKKSNIQKVALMLGGGLGGVGGEELLRKIF